MPKAMKKVLLPILYISLIAPILFGAFDAKADHTVLVQWCKASKDVFVSDLNIMKGEERVHRVLKDAIISKDHSKVKFDGQIELMRRDDSVHSVNASTLSTLLDAQGDDAENFGEICNKVRNKKSTEVPATEPVAECTIEVGYGFTLQDLDPGDVELKIFGLAIYKLNIKTCVSESKVPCRNGLTIFGLIKGGKVSNIPNDITVNAVLKLVRNTFKGYSFEPVEWSQANKENIAHKAVSICKEMQRVARGGSPASASSGKASQESNGVSGGSPADNSGSDISGTAGTAKIQEGCNVGRKIEFKDGDTTVSFEDDEFVGPGNDRNTGKWGVVCAINTVNTIANWFFFILISVAFVFILYAGFLFMTAGTNPENKDKAGQMIAAALVGIVIAILARVIPGVITGILT